MLLNQRSCMDTLPSISTEAETSYSSLKARNWQAFVAPGKTPEPILERWNQEIVNALNDPEVSKMLNEYGLTPQPTTRQELAAFIKKEYVQWGEVVKQGNLQGSN